MAERTSDTWGARVGDVSWADVEAELDRRGFASLGQLLSAAESQALSDRFGDDTLFRKTIQMERHGFGRGTYRYFADPLPEPVASLRRALFPPLRTIAARWERALGRPGDFPPTLADFRVHCAEAGQTLPTPLLLRYGPGDYNRLHQDRYGDVGFPLQVVVGLSRPGEDFTGGEFLLVEGRARMQSQAHVVPLAQGEAVVFPNFERPVSGTRGFVRCQVRHGVSELRTGGRTALGLIFHDAR